MATIKVKDSIYSLPAYGNLESDERALFWELLGLTRHDCMIRIEDAAWKLRRHPDAKCRTIRQSLAILLRAGLVRIEDDRVEVICEDAKYWTNAPAMAKVRSKAPIAQPAAPSVAVEKLAEKKKTQRVPRTEIPPSLNFTRPAYVDESLFKRFLQIRSTNTRKAITQEMVDRWTKDLEALNAAGEPVDEVIKQTNERGWFNFFALSKEHKAALAPAADAPAPAAPVVINLPDFVPADIFNEYLAKRALTVRQPLTQIDIDCLLGQLADLHGKRVSMSATIRRSIIGGVNGIHAGFFYNKDDVVARRGGVAL